MITHYMKYEKESIDLLKELKAAGLKFDVNVYGNTFSIKFDGTLICDGHNFEPYYPVYNFLVGACFVNFVNMQKTKI